MREKRIGIKPRVYQDGDNFNIFILWSVCIAVVSNTREWWRSTMWQAAPGT